MSEPVIADRPGDTRARHRRPDRPTNAVRRDRRRPRVAVVDRHALVAESIGLTLTGLFETIPVPLQSCTSTAAARDAVLRTRADIVVLILSPGGVVDTLTLVEQLTAQGLSVLATGDDLDLRTSERYLRAGASAFWPAAGVAGILDAIAQEAERRTMEQPRPVRLVRESDLDAVAADRPDDDTQARRSLADLTAGEARILWALMRGKGADDIAHDHVVSIATVRTQIKQVLAKLGVKSQVAAVAIAWRVDWAPGGDPSAN